MCPVRTKQGRRVACSAGCRNAKALSASSAFLGLGSGDLVVHFNSLKFSPSLIFESPYSVGPLLLSDHFL